MWFDGFGETSHLEDCHIGPEKESDWLDGGLFRCIPHRAGYLQPTSNRLKRNPLLYWRAESKKQKTQKQPLSSCGMNEEGIRSMFDS